jgi:hypothetical protein
MTHHMRHSLFVRAVVEDGQALVHEVMALGLIIFGILGAVSIVQRLF